MKTLRHIADHFEELVLVIAFAAMLIINFGNVCGRYVFHSSWAFTEEVCMIAFLYVTFFGASLAVRKHQHLGFTLLYEKLTGKAKLIVDTVSMLMILALMYFAVRYGIAVVQNQMNFHSVTSALHIPVAVGSISVPLGSLCIAVRTIQNYILNIREYRAGREKEERM